MDENLHDHRLIAAIAAWYPGQVMSVTTLRPGTVIKDEAIPTLLQQASQPTFVTINVTDFWLKVQPHSSYCIVAVILPRERVREIPGLLRDLLRLPDFRTKAARMGRVVRVTSETIQDYESNRIIQALAWPD